MNRSLRIIFFIACLLSIGHTLSAQQITLRTSYVTDLSQNKEFILKINAPQDKSYSIDYGDGTGVHQYTGTGKNQVLYYAFADMQDRKEHTVKIWGASFTEFMVISNRNVSHINLEGCGDLVKFSCANSDLKKLDLSACKSLKEVICNANRISDLRVPEGLKKIDFSLNCLSLSKFPKKEAGMNSFSYKYGPMRPVTLSEDKINGLTVDLCEMLFFTAGKGTKSTFKWYYAKGEKNLGDDSSLIAPGMYTEKDGIFTFYEKPKGKIYCVVENNELPQLDNIADKYGIMPIELHGENETITAVHVAFMTDKYTTDNLTFDLTLAAKSAQAPCKIAWGDGTFDELKLSEAPQTIKHNFIDAKVDRVHQVRIECPEIKRMELPETCGFISFEGTPEDSPIEEVIMNLNRVDAIDFSPFVHAKEIEANACYTKQITLPAASELSRLSLRASAIETIDLTGYTQLSDLNLASNQLKEINLATQTHLKKVDLSNNKIRHLTMPTAYDELTDFNCANNAIPLYELPEKKNMTSYIYAPQSSYVIRSEEIRGFTVDLSAFDTLKGVSDTPMKTKFTWLDADNDENLVVKGVMYDEKDGIFNFKLFKNQRIYCLMESDAFPDFSQDKNVYRTLPISMKSPTDATSLSEDSGIRISNDRQTGRCTIVTNKAERLLILTLSGQKVADVTLAPNEEKVLSLENGSYVIIRTADRAIKFVI